MTRRLLDSFSRDGRRATIHPSRRNYMPYETHETGKEERKPVKSIAWWKLHQVLNRVVACVLYDTIVSSAQSCVHPVAHTAPRTLAITRSLPQGRWRIGAWPSFAARAIAGHAPSCPDLLISISSPQTECHTVQTLQVFQKINFPTRHLCSPCHDFLHPCCLLSRPR